MAKPKARTALDTALALFGRRGGASGTLESDRPLGAVAPVAASLDRGELPRGVDVPFGYNLATAPRSGDGLDLSPFSQLRALASYDLVRIAIEDVKGQIRGMEWDVRARKAFEKESDKLAASVDATRALIENMDALGGLSFDDWLGQALEEILVVDALTISPRKNLGGELIGLELIDGATIKPLLDSRGRPPLPPAAAFQQVINGAPETEFALGEIVYAPFTRRSSTPYGFPRVEMVLYAVNLALRRDLYDLHYFSSGNQPDGGLWSVAESWTPKQIAEYQSLMDALTGRDEKRAGQLRIMPPGQYFGTKNHEWHYEFREWLARVIAWAFGVSPLPIAKQMNRSTSETSETSATESGVRPLAKFLARVVNRTLAQHGGIDPKVEFAWLDDETEDATTVVERNRAYVGMGVSTINSVRVSVGQEPIEPEIGDEPLWNGPNGPIFLRDLARARELAADEKTGRIDPSLVQRAFLEVPLIRRNELRASLGLPAIEGPEGEEFVTIAQTSPAAFGPPGGTPPPSGRETVAAGEGSTAPVPPEAPEAEDEPEDDEAEAEIESQRDGSGDGDDPPSDAEKAWTKAFAKYRARVRADLSLWRKVEAKRAKAGKAPRPFRSACIAPGVLAKLADGVESVRKLSGPDAALAAIAAAQDLFKGEPVPSRRQSAAERRVAGVVSAWLDSVAPRVTAWALAALREGTAGKAASDNWRAATVKADAFPEIEPGPRVASDLFDALLAGAEAGARDAALALGATFTRIPPEAATFARTRAGELVGMKWSPTSGTWETNPDRTFAISDTLRERVQGVTVKAIEEGWSPQALAADLKHSFSTQRSETIARTETGFAYGNGTAEIYKTEGVESVEVLDGDGCLPFGHRDGAPKAAGENGIVFADSEANGQVWTLAQYRGAILGHPNCVRAAIPSGAVPDSNEDRS